MPLLRFCAIHHCIETAHHITAPAEPAETANADCLKRHTSSPRAPAVLQPRIEPAETADADSPEEVHIQPETATVLQPRIEPAETADADCPKRHASSPRPSAVLQPRIEAEVGEPHTSRGRESESSELSRTAAQCGDRTLTNSSRRESETHNCARGANQHHALSDATPTILHHPPLHRDSPSSHCPGRDSRRRLPRRGAHPARDRTPSYSLE